MHSEFDLPLYTFQIKNKNFGISKIPFVLSLYEKIPVRLAAVVVQWLSVSKNMAVGSSEVALGEAALKCTKTCSPLYKR